jgi:hypothetical protein
MCVLPSRLILFDLTFSLVPGPLFLLALVAFKVSALVSLCQGQQMLANFLGVLPILTPPLCCTQDFNIFLITAACKK